MATDQSSVRQRWHKFTAAEELQIHRDRTSGMTLAAVGAKWGCCPEGVRKIVNRIDDPPPPFRHGVSPRPACVPILSPEQDGMARADYEAGMSSTRVAAKYGVSVPAALDAIRRAGGTIRSPKECMTREERLAAGKKRRVLSDQDEAELSRRYAAGEHTRNLKQAFNCTLSAVYEALIRTGTPRRKTNRSCDLNEYAFHDVESNPAGQYFLGLLLADGTVAVRAQRRGGPSYVVRLGLAEEDAVQVERFRAFIGSSHKVHVSSRKASFRNGKREYRAQPCHRAHATSRVLVSKLMEYGVVPRKSGREKAHPSMLASRRFWSGLVDGDGFLYFTTDPHYGGLLPHVGLVGSYELLCQFKDFVRSLTPSEAVPHPMGSIWSYRVAGRHAYEVAKALYGDNEMAMPRKLAKAREIISYGDEHGYREARADWEWPLREHLVELWKRLGSWKAVAGRLGIPGGSISYVRGRLGLLGDVDAPYTSEPVASRQKRFDWSKVTLPQVESLKAELGTWCAVAARLGVTAGSLSQFVFRSRREAN